jgi:hypothetical protein
MFPELKAFFEENPLAHKAADSIRNGRQIALEVPGDGTTKVYIFTKEGGKNVLREGDAQSADVIFTIPVDSAQELVTRKFDSVAQVGLHIFEKILSNDPKQKIQIRLKTGVLSLIAGGYLGVLTAGGGDVAKFMASRGLGSMGKIKDAITKLRG